MKIKINKKIKILVGGFLILFCGSAMISGIYQGITDDSPVKDPTPKIEKVEVVEDKKENKITHQDFAITDGKLYKDIEISEDLRSYKIPEGKWNIMQMEDGTVKMNDGSTKTLDNILLTFSSDQTGNTDIRYNRSFDYEVKKGETVWFTMQGRGAQFYFKALN